MSVPVGSIVASILSHDDFMREVPEGETWALADGTALENNHLAQIIRNGGADYAQFKREDIQLKPNLNGVFLRGRDYAHEPDLRNPDGSVPPGTFQNDQMRSHTHGVDRVNGNDGARTAGGSDAWYGKRGDQSDAFGGPETRPKNVTVNFYIRTN